MLLEVVERFTNVEGRYYKLAIHFFVLEYLTAQADAFANGGPAEEFILICSLIAYQYNH